MAHTPGAVKEREPGAVLFDVQFATETPIWELARVASWDG